MDSGGNIYVTGQSWNGGKWRSDYATIKYYPDGRTAWVRRYNGPAPEDWLDGAYAIAVDDSGNVYVTGWSDFSLHEPDYATIKYRSDGAELWVRRYNASEPAHLSDGAFALAIDDSGYIYVTGASSVDMTGYDYATIKYYPNGDTAWVRRYNGPGNSIDEALAITVDDSGNVYVTGYSDQSGSYNYDYATIKYYPDGQTAWVSRYNGPGNSYDIAYAIALDDFGNVYVTGGSAQDSIYPYNFDYTTIKYNSLGTQCWPERYNGPGNSDDIAYAMAVDDSNNVYVTGGSVGIGTDYDYATIKYIPTYGLISPNGGEAWQAGHQYYIMWSFEGFSGNVRIDYSVNSGASFDSMIVNGYPNSGQYLWIVHSRTSSSHCRVRVCDVLDCNPADSSDSDFTIYICGDCTDDGVVNSADIVFIVNYMFAGGPKPNWPLIRIDVTGDGIVNSADIVYLVNYMFAGGPKPNCPDL